MLAGVEVPEFYGSSVYISVSPYEVIVDVGRRDPSSGDVAPEFRQRMMSWFTVLQRYLDLAAEDIERAHAAHSPADKLLGEKQGA